MNSNDTQFYSAEKIFTGDEWLTGKAVAISNGKIIGIVEEDAVKEKITHKAHLLAPAFIDVQIYGAYGKLLSVYPDAASLHLLYKYCSEGGASHFQPTAATNSHEVFYKCIDAVKEYWNEGGKGCLGLHIEGPWIHPAKKGAHIESFIHSPSVEEARDLLEYGKGVITMITLAPEFCSKEVMELIRSYGAIISAGHSNATYEQATQAFNEGIETATHLYNAMSAFQHRAPGMVGAIFDHSNAMTSIVPDGYHVDFPAVRIAKKILKERLFVITDAVTETESGPYPHYLVGDKYEAGGILSGSALTMAKCVRNLVNHAGVELGEALKMAGLYPAQVMKKNEQMGKIAEGFDSNLVLMDEGLEVLRIVGS